MHVTSLNKMRRFADTYLSKHTGVSLEILDVGSQAVEGMESYRPVFERQGWNYRGLDLVAGENVDLVVEDAYHWTVLADASVDVVVSGQALEHIEYPWETIREIARVLRPGGLVCLIAPSAGPEHRYPQDCWRIYPDGMRSLASYAGLKVVEIFTDWGLVPWQDTFAVLQKPRGGAPLLLAPFGELTNCGAAKSAYYEAIATRPRNSAYYANLARLLLNDDRSAEAITALRVGLELAPGQTDLRHRLIALQLDLGLTGAALEQAIALLNARPISLANVEAVADVFDRLGELERQVLIGMLPADTAGLKRISSAADSKGRFGLAAVCWERLAAADPGNHANILCQALSLRGSGQTDVASNFFHQARDLQLERGTINRTTVVQRLIWQMKAQVYVEIGVERGLNYFQIEAPLKFAVDPEFQIPGGTEDGPGDRFIACESDVFFGAPPAELFEHGIDIVLVDGLHTKQQALRDVENSLRFLNPGGIVVMHDCLPASEAEACGDQAVARRMPGFTGDWVGDVFKTVLHLRATRPDLFVCVLDTDHGIGLVASGQPENMLALAPEEIETIAFGDLRRRAGELLNLKPANWFNNWLSNRG